MSSGTLKQDKSAEIKFFDRFTLQKDYDSLTEEGYSSIESAFRECLGENSSKIQNAIDLGCGTGSFTRRFLNPAKIKSFGADISLNAIQRARSKNDGIQYCVSDICQLGIKDASMDLVIFSGVLHHFPEIEICLNEAYRILKKNGIVLCFEPHINNPFMWLYRHPKSFFYSKTGITKNEHLLSKKDLQQALEKSKFNSCKIFAISGVTFSFVESPFARILLPLYNLVESLLGKLKLAKNYGSFVICCGKKEEE